jgi:transcriptional regulator with XRE-family HTH domain
MGMFRSRWQKLAGSRAYRAGFIAAQAKQAIPYQIRALLKAQGISQEQLAERAELTQGVISRAANPHYGNLSINTCVKVAAGFDVAFIGKFVPFSELDRWIDHLHDESVIPTFETEDKYADYLFEKFDIPNESDWSAEEKRSRIHEVPPPSSGQLGFGSAGAGKSLRGGANGSRPRLVIDNVATEEDSPNLANRLNQHQPITDHSELLKAATGV